MLARRPAREDTEATVAMTPTLLDLIAVGQHVDPGVPIVIHGEAGVGKKTLARLIHAASVRRPYDFIYVNCAASSVDQHAIDLFGCERRGSDRRRLGSFELADRGTLYLDEIERVAQVLARKLLHVVQTGEVSRSGSQETMRVDVRLIASTMDGDPACVDCELCLGLKRHNAVEIRVPPLRQRTAEIRVLASLFLERLNRRYRRHAHLGADQMARLQRHSWPGNIRELEDAVRRLVLG